MKTIRLTPPMQILALLGAVAVVVAAVVAQLPEIERYLKVKAM